MIVAAEPMNRSRVITAQWWWTAAVLLACDVAMFFLVVDPVADLVFAVAGIALAIMSLTGYSDRSRCVRLHKDERYIAERIACTWDAYFDMDSLAREGVGSIIAEITTELRRYSHRVNTDTWNRIEHLCAALVSVHESWAAARGHVVQTACSDALNFGDTLRARYAEHQAQQGPDKERR